jgi:hypothetical protein
MLSPSEGGEYIAAERRLNLIHIPSLHDVESQKHLISRAAHVEFNRYDEDLLHICW